jgi:hypothetical protein
MLDAAASQERLAGDQTYAAITELEYEARHTFRRLRAEKSELQITAISRAPKTPERCVRV